MFMSWKNILAFLFPNHTLTAQEWYRLLASHFHPPKAHMSWMVKRGRLEMSWQQLRSSLLETPE